MKVAIFSFYEKEELEESVSGWQKDNPSIQIIGRSDSTCYDVAANCVNYTVFLYYESLEEQGARQVIELYDEQERLKANCKIVGDLLLDPIYPALKNLRQRELFLLTKGLNGKDASDIIALMAPEMAYVVEWGRRA